MTGMALLRQAEGSSAAAGSTAGVVTGVAGTSVAILGAGRSGMTEHAAVLIVIGAGKVSCCG